MEKKLDISSTAVEKGIDVAKDFLDKLIMPAIEGTGLLLYDQVNLWRFKNQIKMVNKAQIYCEKNNIKPKQISLKLLCPLLDYSALEEDELILDKWAILLSNLVDSDQNIENHVFPYILSQLSSKEFQVLEKVYDEKLIRIQRITNELENFKTDKPRIEEELRLEIKKIESKKWQIMLDTGKEFSNEIWDLQKEIRKYENQINSLKYKEISLLQSLKKHETIPLDSVKDFELSNLIRLGVIKEEKEFYANSQTLEIPINNESEYMHSHLKVDLDIDVDSNIENILTELGELFIKACKEKS